MERSKFVRLNIIQRLHKDTPQPPATILQDLTQLIRPRSAILLCLTRQTLEVYANIVIASMRTVKARHINPLVLLKIQINRDPLIRHLERSIVQHACLVHIVTCTGEVDWIICQQPRALVQRPSTLPREKRVIVTILSARILGLLMARLFI